MGFRTDAVLAHRDGGSSSRYEFPRPSGGILRMPVDKTCFVNSDPHIASWPMRSTAASKRSR
jgi:hypothetical protein